MKRPAVLLTEFLAACEARPFDWAAANCCHFAAAWVQMAEGRNPMAGLPVTATARDALRLVRVLGGSLQAAWTRQLGREPIAPAFAQVGDLLLFPSGQSGGVGHVVGICAGLTAVVQADDGAAVWHVPRDGAVAAWAVRIEVAA